MTAPAIFSNVENPTDALRKGTRLTGGKFFFCPVIDPYVYGRKFSTIVFRQLQVHFSVGLNIEIAVMTMIRDRVE